MNQEHRQASSTVLGTSWYHGTESAPFQQWHIPNTNVAPFDVPHSCAFFSDLSSARQVGRNVCSIRLTPGTAIIIPGIETSASEAMRTSVFNRNPLARHALWLRNNQVWSRAWQTGEVMRFAVDVTDPTAVQDLSGALKQTAQTISKCIKSPAMNEQIIAAHAMQCFTRGWIETLVQSAKSLGFQAIYGAEIDRHSGTTPVSRPWLAVTTDNVISPPNWL